MKIGIIGGTGWLGSALGQALLARGLPPADLIILNRSGPRADYFGHAVTWAADATDLVAKSEVIVVSVRPQDWPALRLDPADRLVISFMAGVGLAALGPRAVRAMPNAAAEIGASYSPFRAGPGVSAQDKATAAHILSHIGTTDELADEAQIDLMTALSGSGPAYPALMAAAMLEFLRENGVAPSVAERAVEATVCAAPRLLAGRIATAPDLVQVFIDYAGTTAAGLREAERLGFGSAVKSALHAATAKSRAMRDSP